MVMIQRPRLLNLFVLGLFLRMQFNSKHPVAFGMPDEAPVVFTRSPAFSISLSSKNNKPSARAIAHYQGNELLISGYLKGEKYLRNKVSAIEVPVGKGKVILLGFGVQSRAQPYGTFKLLFNSLYYSSSS